AVRGLRADLRPREASIARQGMPKCVFGAPPPVRPEGNAGEGDTARVLPAAHRRGEVRRQPFHVNQGGRRRRQRDIRKGGWQKQDVPRRREIREAGGVLS
ncbi:unnamed protein product, partial [Ectocarpus sp. 8 AP-2014]